MRKPYPTDLSDAEWTYIEPHLPAPKGYGRPRTHSLREILNAVFYLLKMAVSEKIEDSGSAAEGLCQLPPEPKTVGMRLVRKGRCQPLPL
jgi:hypothetical protein